MATKFNYEGNIYLVFHSEENVNFKKMWSVVNTE